MTDFVVASPDYDVFVEEADFASGDLAAMRFSDEQWPPPPGVSRVETYRCNFRALTPAKMRELEAEGEAAAAQHVRAAARSRGVPYRVPPGGAMVPLDEGPLRPPPEAVAAAGAAPPSEDMWVHIETTGHGRRGEAVVLTGGEVIRGEVGLKLFGDDWVAIRRLRAEAAQRPPAMPASWSCPPSGERGSRDIGATCATGSTWKSSTTGLSMGRAR